MIDYQSWYDRFENVLELQKYLQEEEMSIRLNRRELIELRTMAKILIDLEEKNGSNEHI